MTEFYGEPLSWWREQAWWPEGWDAHVMLGPPGHEREIVVGFDGRYDWDTTIPRLITEMFAKLLPESWKMDSRGTRFEVHPSGHFAGGFHEDDASIVLNALTELGFKPTVTYP